MGAVDVELDMSEQGVSDIKSSKQGQSDQQLAIK